MVPTWFPYSPHHSPTQGSTPTHSTQYFIHLFTANDSGNWHVKSPSVGLCPPYKEPHKQLLQCQPCAKWPLPLTRPFFCVPGPALSCPVQVCSLWRSFPSTHVWPFDPPPPTFSVCVRSVCNYIYFCDICFFALPASLYYVPTFLWEHSPSSSYHIILHLLWVSLPSTCYRYSLSLVVAHHLLLLTICCVTYVTSLSSSPSLSTMKDIILWSS